METEDEQSLLISNSRNLPEIKWYRRIIGIPLFIYFFASSLSDNVFSNLILYKTCTLTFHYNETICNLVVNSKNETVTKELEEILQPYATDIVMIKQLVEGIFPAIISLFLGSWSDTNGRKPLIIFPLCGYFGYFCLCIIFSQMDNLNPWYLIVAVMPCSIMGGLSLVVTGCFCFVSDTTMDNNRSFGMAMLEASILCGILSGSFISSYVFMTLNYVGVFIICALLVLIGILYSIIMLSESVRRAPDDIYSNILDMSLFSDMVKTCFKVRLNNCRLIICLTMMASTVGVFIVQGDSTVNYYFTREKLNWKLEEYTLYNSYSIVILIIGIGIVTMVLQKLLKCSDGIISIMSYISAAARSIIVACSSTTFHMYIGATISCLRGVSSAMNRAILTLIVPPDEAGKILSFTTSLETIVPLMASPLYSYIYKKTLLGFPGAYNLLSAGLYVVDIFLIGIVECLLRINTNRHNQITDETS